MEAKGDEEVTRKLLSASRGSLEESGGDTDTIIEQSRDFSQENRTS